MKKRGRMGNSTLAAMQVPQHGTTMHQPVKAPKKIAVIEEGSGPKMGSTSIKGGRGNYGGGSIG